MISENVRLTSIGVRMTAPFTRSAAARMSSFGGGGNFGGRRSRSLGPGQCYAKRMHKPLLALAAALLATSAAADTLIDNVNGIQVGVDGKLQHFSALLIDNQGKVELLIPPG